MCLCYFELIAYEFDIQNRVAMYGRYYYCYKLS